MREYVYMYTYIHTCMYVYMYVLPKTNRRATDDPSPGDWLSDAAEESTIGGMGK